MTKHEFAALACKVLGIYTLVNALGLLPSILGNALNSLASSSTGLNPALATVERTAAVAYILPLAFDIMAGLLLWRRADFLAARMIRDTDAAPSQIAIGAGAETVAFSFLGLFTLLQAIPRLGLIVFNLILMSRQGPLLHRDYKGMAAPDVVVLVIQLCLGCWLLLGAAGLARLLGSLRHAGADAAAREAADLP